MTIFSSALMGMGYMLMRATIPTPEETYAAMAPDLRKKVDANRAARLAQENAMSRQVDAQVGQCDPDTAKPIWADAKK